MMKRSITTCLLLVLLSRGVAQSQKEATITIIGTVRGDTKGHHKIYSYSRNRKKDSVEIKEGKFTLVLPFVQPDMELFYTEYEVKQRGMYAPFALLVDRPGVIYLKDIDLAKGLHETRVEGLKSAELYQSYALRQRVVYQKINAVLADMYGRAWAQPKDPLYSLLDKSRDSLTRLYLVPLAQDFVREHPDSYASVYVLNAAGRSLLTLSEMQSSYQALSKRMKKTSEGKSFGDFIQGVQRSAIGSRVDNFTLPDEKGNNFSFASLKGKYVLIDFWASWCVPCRRSFPHMREVYKQYKNDQFEIYSISIDKDKEAWLKAVEQEKNPWLQALDTKNLSQKGFAITGVPTTFLIDPQGKILMKEVGFSPDGTGEIEKKLQELFGKK
jgi:thiol-disulfide isomerase/thioredoxin